MFRNPHIKRTRLEWEMEGAEDSREYKTVLIVETNLPDEATYPVHTSDADDVLDEISEWLKREAINVRVVRVIGKSGRHAA